MATLLVALVSSLLALCSARSTFSPARPPSIPLAVKNPYMSTWQNAGSDGSNGGYLAGQWPSFWTGQATGWCGLIRVDGITYTWMGMPTGPAVVNQTHFEYTSTRSRFTQNVNNIVGINVTFMSPVTPDDLMRASLPFSYVDVEVFSLDGNQHDVQLYTDVSAEWTSGDRNAVAQWEYGVISGSVAPPVSQLETTMEGPQPTRAPAGQIHRLFATLKSYEGWKSAVVHQETDLPVTTATPTALQTSATSAANSTTSAPANQPTQIAGIAYHKFWRQTQLLFSETRDQADWGNWYYLTSNTSTLTHESGADLTVRGRFISNGSLSDSADTDYRAISNRPPVFGFALNLGSVGAQPISSLFGLSLNQADAVQFEGAANSTAPVPSLWTSYWPNELDAISFFYNDYSTASSLATDFDNRVASDTAAAAGQNYTTVASLAVRQAFGGLQLCGTQNATCLFMKEISSNGNMQTVDVIFPLHPLLIWSNPMLLKLMLDPLFIHQEAGNWPFMFSIHDLGTHYPNATGHNDGNAEQQPLEECGNMIIMALAYAQRTNDNAWLNSHYDILRQWNQYLVEEALIPANQISTDDFAGSLANQTNLALKGIIGIEAMAQIANRTGHADDGANYTQIAHDYITQWQQLAIAADANPPHTTLSYGNNSSHGLLYNLYCDRELGLELVPQSVYDMQSNFYPTVELEYGVPLDTRHTYTKSDWEMFCAAVASTSTRDMFINDIAKWINETPTSRPMTDLYDVITGDYPTNLTFAARPVVGGRFSLLALNSAPSSGFVAPPASA